MGTPFGTDERLSILLELGETHTNELIDILKQNFLSDKLSLGRQYSDRPIDFKVIYTIVDTEFENVFLELIHRNTENGFPYLIKLEMRNLDSPVQWTIELDDILVNKLPKKMIAKMEDEMDKMFAEKFNF